MTKKKRIVLTVVAAVIALILICVALAFLLPGSDDSTAEVGIMDEYLDSTYSEYLDSVGYTGEEDLSSAQVVIDVTAFDDGGATTQDGDPVAQWGSSTDDDGEIVEGVQIAETGDVTWTFTVEEEGYYNLRFDYISIAKTTSTPQRGLKIDDEYFYDGMEQIEFARTWDNGTVTDKGGNEMRPTAVEMFPQTTMYASDVNKRTLSPYVFYLEAGEHTLSLIGSREPLQINAIVFEAAPIAPSYEEYRAQNEGAEYAGDQAIILQAERCEEGATTKITKSTPSINVSTDYASSYTVPYHHWYQMLNTMGGDTWATAGDSITWTFNVETPGYYQITLRARQNTNRGVMSFRSIKINGETPFKEAEKVGFEYATNFENYVISMDDEPLLFYFDKGENTITMEVVLGDFAHVLSEVEDSVLVLNTMYRKVVQITGTVPDSYIDYEIGTKVPGFQKAMEEQAAILNSVVDELIEITGEKGSGAVQIEKVAQQCEEFAEDPDEVVDQVSDFKSNISALGDWMLDIASMPLEVDSITLSKPNAELKSAEPNSFVAIGHEMIRFFATFFTDSSTISSDSDVSGDSLKVWIASGRDQATIIRNLIDSGYENSVNLQLIPSGVLLPSILAGTGPDVSLANAQSSVVDYAVRGAIVDLSQFDDFDEFVSDRFYDSALDTATYNGGVYGLPETQSFYVLFYRSDILEELGLEVPETWDDVEEAINVLHIENYDFYIPTTGIYTSMVFQYGGDVYHGAAGTVSENGYVYDETGKDYGIESGLRDEPAMLAFKRLTDFFTTYALPVSADFTNRFRTGEIPLGIADYTLFNTLEVSAPEIKGLWGFALMPGYEDPETGEVDHSSVSTSTHTMIMQSSDQIDEAWNFLKWWLSDDVQLQYGNTIEAQLGGGARYATANTAVLKQLPWSTDQANVLVEQFENTVGVPDVPGYYMTSREVTYAFDDVVTDGQNPREALYLNVKEINDELTIKREEFHLSRLDEEGNVIND
ncbi:MAG: extracellular solute-binding protein [Clostridia bacterium]|nr:extracellular solute-binding protein [Clostridia bacterium]